jgi:hypothetical protein
MKLHRKWLIRWYAVKDTLSAASGILIVLALMALLAVFFLWSGPE